MTKHTSAALPPLQARGSRLTAHGLDRRHRLPSASQQQPQPRFADECTRLCTRLQRCATALANFQRPSVFAHVRTSLCAVTPASALARRPMTPAQSDGSSEKMSDGTPPIEPLVQHAKDRCGDRLTEYHARWCSQSEAREPQALSGARDRALLCRKCVPPWARHSLHAREPAPLQARLQGCIS